MPSAKRCRHHPDRLATHRHANYFRGEARREYGSAVYALCAECATVIRVYDLHDRLMEPVPYERRS